MPAHRTFPLQLVNQVIDELGEAYPYPRGSHDALRACALVSKRWTPRSRMHMFKKVTIKEPQSQPTMTPPTSILPYIKELEISHGFGTTKPTFFANILNGFAVAPIEHLVITRGALVDERACIQECINAHSTTLQTVEFRGCSISAYNIADIVSEHHNIKGLRLDYCKFERLPPPGRPIIADTPDPDSRSKAVELELSLSGGDPEEGPMGIATMVARLPYRFSRLDVDHAAAGYGTTKATNGLIKANAGVLSSLRMHIQAGMFGPAGRKTVSLIFIQPEDMEVDIEPEHLFSLEGCSNLSELTLDMEHSESCAIQDSIFILSTLDPERSTRVEKIVLEARYVCRWFNKDGPVSYGKDEDDDEDDEDEDGDKKVNWEGLDTVLSKLAEASIGVRDKRLTFILVVLEFPGNKEVMSTMKKWLPKLLPCFNELGLLHVHRGRGSRCRAVDDSCLSHDKPSCLA